MKFEFFIAKKHIFEHKKQSLIAVIGIAIGIIVLTVSIGISNGLRANMIDSILSLSSHIIIQGNDKIKNYDKIEKQLQNFSDVKGVFSKVSTQGIIKYTNSLGNYASGVKIEGMDFKKAISIMGLDKKITLGKIEPDNKKGILLGHELFNKLQAHVGDTVTIISANGKQLDLTITGVFKSGYYDYDLSMVLIPLETAQYMTERDDTVSSVNVILYDPYNADRVSKEIDSRMKIATQTWGSMNHTLLKAMALEKTVMVIGFSLIIIIAVFVVWVILNTMVREKIKYIGIMRSMGLSHKNIVNVFLIQGITLGLSGIVIGTAISLSVLWFLKNYSLPGIDSLYYLPDNIPVKLSVEELGTIITSNVILVFLSSYFPAYRAGNLQIVEALKHD